MIPPFSGRAQRRVHGSFLREAVGDVVEQLVRGGELLVAHELHV
jgi:hypothetical protein